MARMTGFKTIIKDAVIEDESFYLVRFYLEGMTEEERGFEWLAETMYGTIKKEDVDSKTGKIMKRLSLADLWAGKSVGEAIRRRQDAFEAQRTIERLKADGIIRI